MQVFPHASKMPTLTYTWVGSVSKMTTLTYTWVGSVSKDCSNLKHLKKKNYNINELNKERIQKSCHRELRCNTDKTL